MSSLKEFEELYNQYSNDLKEFGKFCDQVSTNIKKSYDIVSTKINLPTQIPLEQKTTRQMVIEAYSNTIKNNMDQSKNSDVKEAMRDLNWNSRLLN